MSCCSSSYNRFIWPRGPMDKASAYGAGDCRFGVIAADPTQTAKSIHAPKLKLAITALAHVEQIHYGSSQAPPRLDSV